MDKCASQVCRSDIIVYLVDDDRGMVTATSQWLSLSGLKVRAFADPTALIKVLKPAQACVIISDIRMPGIDGIELMKLVHGRDQTIPVILITGHGDIPLAVEAMKLGAYEFLQKPFSPEKLLETVQQAIVDYSQRVSAVEPAVEDTGSLRGETIETQMIRPDDPRLCGQLSGQVDAYEKELIEAALLRHGGSIAKTIEELDIPRRTLNAKMRKHGIDRTSFR